MGKRSKKKTGEVKAKAPAERKPWDRPEKAHLHGFQQARFERPNTKYIRQGRGR